MPLNHSTKYSQLTDEHFKAIGKIVVEWSNIEHLLSMLLSRLLLTNEFLGRGFTDRMNASHLLDTIGDALKIHEVRYNNRIISKELVSDIKNIKKEINNFRSTRNKISHLLWMRSNDEEIFGVKFSAKLQSNKDQDNSLKISIKELDQYYKKGHAIVEDLQAIVYRALPPLDDARVQEWLRFENSSLPSRGLEDTMRMRYHHRVYQDHLKSEKE